MITSTETQNEKKETGIVNIHGREYQTVALRVQTFRSDHPDYSLTTEMVDRNDEFVVFRATIADVEKRVLATGHAEEYRRASQINKTSALENAETSAIGRALAALGYGGTEFASANEVHNAIHQQEHPAVETTQKVLKFHHEEQAQEGENFTARITNIDHIPWEKNGKTGIRHAVTFDNGSQVSTFEEKVIGKAAVGDRVSATIRKKGKYFDLLSMTVLGAGEEGEKPVAKPAAPKKSVYNSKRDEVNSIWESRIIDYEEEPNGAGKMVWTFKFEEDREAWTSNQELAERACKLIGDVPLTITVRPGRMPGEWVLMGVDE